MSRPGSSGSLRPGSAMYSRPGSAAALNTERPGLADDNIGIQALHAKNARVQAEHNREMLQNRINRLIIEEERAAKRIEETRRRTQEIGELKSRNVASQSAQRDAGEWVASEQVVQKQLLQQTREERRRNVAISRENVERLRRDEAAALKLSKRENEDAVTMQRNVEHARCVARKQFVLEQQRAAQERKAQERQTAVFRVREQREAKREQVHDDTATQLHKFAALAEEERRLVESLQGWRSEQQQAFSQLETELVRDSGSRSG